MNTIDQWAAFLLRSQNRAFEEARKSYPTVYDQFTKKGDTSKADYRSVTAAKLGPAGYTPLGGATHTDEYAPGTEQIIKYKKYTIAVITPEEIKWDMVTADGRVDKDQVRPFAQMSKDMGESMEWTKEIICTDFQLRGAATTVTNSWQGTVRDGLALFSASHVTTKGTPVTWSNYPSAAAMNMLSIVEGVTMLENIPSETGRPGSNVRRIGIVHGRYWSWRVPELIKSLQQPDTFNNNPNLMKVRPIEWVPILNPYLGSAETSWELVDLDNHEQLRLEKTEPTFSKDTDVYTGNDINRAVMRFAICADSAKGVLKNPGL